MTLRLFRKNIRLLYMGTIMLFIAGFSPQNNHETVKDTYAFYNVSVVPMTQDTVLHNQTVVIKGSQIVRIAPADQIKLSPDITVIDGTGQFLVPGLADMHVHIMEDQSDLLNEMTLLLNVANGVTLVRNMWGEAPTLKMRERVILGKIIGPTIITSGRIVDGHPKVWAPSDEIVTVEDARKIVLEQKAMGYDFIKVYNNMSLEVFDAIAVAAKANNISFGGHVPKNVPLDHAMRSGMISMEHLTGFEKITLSDSLSLDRSNLPKERMILAGKLARGEISIGEIFDKHKTENMAETAAKTGIWNVPTLVVVKKMALTSAEVDREFSRPEMRYVPPGIKSFWNPANDFRRKHTTDEQFKGFQEFFKNNLAIVGALHKAGAGILAGTDAANPFIFHGFSIYEELELMVKAGLTPYEAIRTATYNPAKYLGAVGEFGTINEGARADLILLKKNPTEKIAHFQKRTGVMLRGRWLPQAELDKLLEQVATASQ